MGRWFDEIRSDVEARGLPDPYRAFVAHRYGAKVRGISFNLTFEQWWSLWRADWSERGQGANRKCMCRTGDVGPYEIGNVRIDTNSANATEFWQSYHPLSAEAKREKLMRMRANCYDKAARKWLDNTSSTGI
jgi:hypothetical protein